MPAAPLVRILTPDAADPVYERRWQGDFSIYRTLFEGLGARIESRPWPQAPDAPPADVALPLLAWGYHFALTRWETTLRTLEAQGARVANPAGLLLWNTRKTYLRDLEAAGVAVIPTVFADNPSTEEIAYALRSFGAAEGVVKPQVSAGAHRTGRVRVGEPASEGLGPAMIQPFLPAVVEEGELSLFMIDGALRYAVRKVATGGDFRVQPQHGGVLALFEPDAEARALADAAVAAAPLPPLYARVDMVRGLDGRLQLMELECIEPDLYLALAPDGGRGFAQAMMEAATRP
jgi:glutathione synthase/RimK-type ligase-like ATP-grasp enzyme